MKTKEIIICVSAFWHIVKKKVYCSLGKHEWEAKFIRDFDGNYRIDYLYCKHCGKIY